MSTNFLTLKLYDVADFDPLESFNVVFVVCLVITLMVFTETRMFLVHYPFTPTTTSLYWHKIKAKQKQEKIFAEAVMNHPELAQSKIQVNAYLFRKGEEPNPNSPGDIQVKKIEEAMNELINDVNLEPFWALYGSPKDTRAEIIPGWLMEDGNISQFGITLNGWRKNSSGLGPPDGRLFLPDAITIRDTTIEEGLVTVDGRPRIAINLQAFESTNRLKLTLFHEFLHVLGLPAYKPIVCFLEFQSDLAYRDDYYAALKVGNMYFWKEEYREWIIWTVIFIFCLGMIASKARTRGMTMFEFLKEKGIKIAAKIREFPRHFK